MILVELIVFVISLFCFISAGCYFICAMIFMVRHGQRSRPSIPKGQSADLKRFLILVPAHNEEIVLPRLLTSISAIDYPAAFFTSCVICDNCHDSTEKIARQSGSMVLVRQDAEHRGKGYAIQFALSRLDIDCFDVIMITDADTVLEKHILNELAILFRDEKAEAVQCYNSVLNPNDTPLTRLISLARALEIIYMDSRDFLGLTVHLIGNGMCFRTDILKKCPWTAFSISEDLEYFCLLTANGIKVRYSFHSRVFLQEERSLSHAKTQKQRWASGKIHLILKYVPRLLWRSLLNKQISQAEAVMVLLVPNPSLLANLIIITSVLTSVFQICQSAKLLSIISLLFLFFYLISSFLMVKPTIKTMSSLFLVPTYLLWKGLIDFAAIIGKKRYEWLKTKRH